jgi:signal recognition particle subunit SRP54
MLEKLGSSLRDALSKIATFGRIDRDAVEEVVRDIQRALLGADVNVKLVMDLSARIRKKSLQEKPPPGMTAREHVLRVVYQELIKIIGSSAEVELGPQTIFLVGLYGSGKTTTCAKLARYFQKKGLRPGVVCADVYRPAAYDQLQQLCGSIGVPFYGEREGNPVKIASDGLKKLAGCDVKIVDTAGRHSLDKDLIKEMKELAKRISPEHKFLVVDGAMGQLAKDYANSFHDAIGITGVIVTKLDGTAKGGGALSAVAETGRGIAFIGTGETVDDLERFHPDGFISRLLGMGDLKALVEKAEETLREEEVDVRRFMKGKFTLNDLYTQLQAIKRLGPLKNILSMLPLGSFGLDLSEEQFEFTKKKLSSFQVIMDSMTPYEKENPHVIGSSRIARIARGSGRSQEEVRELLKYHRMMQKAMKRFLGKRFPMKQLFRMVP